jgi:hypothetical protein
MLQQEIDDRFAGDVIPTIKLQFVEALVFAHQVADGRVQHRDDLLERRARRRSFQIFDEVELDLAPLQNFQGATRMASAGVVIKRY